MEELEGVQLCSQSQMQLLHPIAVKRAPTRLGHRMGELETELHRKRKRARRSG